jgi:hypothetical protein
MWFGIARRSVFEVNKKPKSYELLNRLNEVVKPELEVFLVDDVLGKGTALGRGQQVFDRIRRSALARVSHWPDHAFWRV